MAGVDTLPEGCGGNEDCIGDRDGKRRYLYEFLDYGGAVCFDRRKVNELTKYIEQCAETVDVKSVEA